MGGGNENRDEGRDVRRGNERTLRIRSIKHGAKIVDPCLESGHERQ